MRQPSRCSRRAFLALVSSGCLSAQKPPSGKGQSYPSEQKRYFDSATEFPVLRLTEPTHSSLLPLDSNDALIGRNSLLFASNREGSFDAYRMDLKSGTMRRLTEVENLDTGSIAMLAGDRGFCFCAGASLRQANMSTLRDRELYRTPTSWERKPGLAVSADGSGAFLLESNGSRFRLRMVQLPSNAASTVVEGTQEISSPLPRPARPQTLYSLADGSVWLVGLEGKRNTQIKLPKGRMGQARWSLDGNSLLYLHLPEEKGQLNSIREYFPESGEDKLIAKTSQFSEFCLNADATVFAGASGSRAAPHIYILVRSVRREMTLCEHRAKNPATVRTLFAMNSQRVVFQSDQHGNPALYMIAVDKFVEETGS